MLWLPAASTAAGAPIDPEALARQAVGAGDALFQDRRFRAALAQFVEAVELQPLEPEYHYRLACTADKAEEPHLVQPHLLEALRLNPQYAPAHNVLAQWYCHFGQLEPALRHSAAALALSPHDPYVVMSRAFVLGGCGQTGSAWSLLERLIGSDFAAPELAQLCADLAPSLGYESQALAVVQRCLQVPGLHPGIKPQLHFAAAALLDSLGQYEEAFAMARRANDLVRRPHDPAAHSQWISLKIGYFTAQRLQSLPRATHGNRRPVFIVGMPRSGTSLVEQILASHPEVFGAGELEELGRIAHAMTGNDWAEGESYPQCLELLSSRAADRLASRYLSAIQALNATARYVTDKLPLNYLNLELVELLFPGCLVIHCLRDPMDTRLSCYFTDFAVGNEFSSNLKYLAAYHRDYGRLMAHWRRVLSLPILEVRYEDLVLDSETQVRRMLQFLDLPWEQRCLKYYENKRRIATASKNQVRRPIYASSIGRWRHYEKHLSDLVVTLGKPDDRQTTT